MKFKCAYVIKDMANRDFSELEQYAKDIRFIYNEGKVKISLPEALVDVMWALVNFDPDKDLLVLNGPNVASAIAFGYVLRKFHHVNIADYIDGGYEIHEVRTLHTALKDPDDRQLYARRINPSEVS